MNPKLNVVPSQMYNVNKPEIKAWIESLLN